MRLRLRPPRAADRAASSLALVLMRALSPGVVVSALPPAGPADPVGEAGLEPPDLHAAADRAIRTARSVGEQVAVVAVDLSPLSDPGRRGVLRRVRERARGRDVAAVEEETLVVVRRARFAARDVAALAMEIARRAEGVPWTRAADGDHATGLLPPPRLPFAAARYPGDGIQAHVLIAKARLRLAEAVEAAAARDAA